MGPVDISSIGPITGIGADAKSGGAAATSGGVGFGDLFAKLVNNANGTQAHSDQLVESLAKGEPTDVHQVMVALTEAELAFRTVLEVRNRLIEAYQEVQRMPV